MIRRTIDITPGAGWRRFGRSLLAVALLVIVLPLLWFIGGLVLLTGLGAALLVGVAAIARSWWRGRRDSRVVTRR